MLQEFTQSVHDTAQEIVNGIHTALPGEIINFDKNNCTATVKPVGKYVTTDGTQLPYPVITDVPVLFPYCQTANVGFAFPLTKGDCCIIIVSEIELDEWRSGAESEAPLRFDLTNSIAIPGLVKGEIDIVSKACEENAAIMASGSTLFMVSSEGVIMESGSAKLSVSSSGINVRGSLNVTGDINTTATVKAGNIDLKEDTGKPE